MKNITKNIVFFFTAIIIVKFIGIFKTFFVAKLLIPSDYGTWIILLLIFYYLDILHLGTLESLMKQVAYYIGKDDLKKVKEVENGVFGFIIIMSIMIILCLIISLFILNGVLNDIIPLIRIVMLSAILKYFSVYHYQRFSAYQNFKQVSKIEVLRAVSNFIIFFLFTWLWGLKGLVYGLLCVEFIILIYSSILSIRKYGSVRAKVDIKLIKNLIHIGFPITIVWWIFKLHSTADRLISISFLGKTATGYYGLGIQIVSITLLAPQAISRVLYPRMNEKIGETSDIQKLVPFVLEPIRTFCLLLPSILCILVMTLPIIYHVFVPEYFPGLKTTQILMFGVFFLSIIRNGANFLIATNNQNKCITFGLISLMINITCSIILVKFGLNIVGIAISTNFSIIILATLMLNHVFEKIGYSRLKRFKNILFLYFPLVNLIVLIFIFRIIFPNFLIETGLISIFYIIIILISHFILLISITTYRKSLIKIIKSAKAYIKNRIKSNPHNFPDYYNK